MNEEHIGYMIGLYTAYLNIQHPLIIKFFCYFFPIKATQCLKRSIHADFQPLIRHENACYKEQRNVEHLDPPHPMKYPGCNRLREIERPSQSLLRFRKH
jgi:hypothetical protein